MANLVASAKAALRCVLEDKADRRGYVARSIDNLLPGIEFDEIEKELRRGDGHELEGKFRAVHSSSALAVNCFGWFKRRTHALSLLGSVGARGVEFEKQLPIFPGRTPANLDVWIDRGDSVVAVESKLLEYLSLKIPTFSSAYESADLACDRWQAAYESAKHAARGHLDRAQLIKHAFGLHRYCREHPDRRATLLYLFWEPTNWRNFEACCRHRSEVEDFSELLTESKIPFRWMPYADLWEEWSRVPALAEHIQALRDRYEVAI